MKTRTLTLVSFALLTTILLGAFALNVYSPAKELKLKVNWKPNSIVLDSVVPDPWIAEIRFAPPQDVENIDPSTILLEGIYSPSAPPYHHYRLERLNVPFYGYDVLTALMMKAPHMGPGTYLVWLEITGQMNDGRYFRGSGTINMTIPEIPPP